MARKLLPLVATVVLLLGFAGPAAAATAVTQTVHNFTQTFVEENPCTGDLATVTTTYNGVFHMSTDDAGGVHVTGTLTGTFELVPLDTSLPSYTGRFTQWFGGNVSANGEGFWVTFRINGTGSDGSVLMLNAVQQLHVSNGELHVDFLKLNCRD